MASVSVPASAGQRRLEPIVAIAVVVCLALWPVQIHTAFGLPAHPLIIHVPVIFVPILGLAAIVLAIWPKLQERWGLPVAIFSVVTMAATLLAVGAGEAFRADREKSLPQQLANNPTLQDHADAGSTLRLTVVLLTLVLVAMLFAKRWPPAVTITLRVLTVLLAATAIFFVIRTGHLGAKLAWGREEGGSFPGFQGGPAGQGQPPVPGGG